MDLHPNWVALATVDIPWKRFISEREAKVDHNTKDSNDKFVSRNITNGEEVQEFYLNLISNAPDKVSESKAHSLCRLTKCKGKSNIKLFEPSDRTVSKYLLAAQNDNVQELEEIYYKYPTILNKTDSFGWTALMCAVQSKALGCIKFLVSIGADKKLEDNNGRSAITLARTSETLNLLNGTTKADYNETDDCSGVIAAPELFCDCCKVYYKENEMKQHLTSTLHVFSSNKKKFPTCYGIPESNKGFQLLLKEGWNKEKGLGPDGSGNKFPLKTKLKTDRKGLGVEENKPARVTYFSANDFSAVSSNRKERQRTVNKKHRIKHLSRERRFEKMFRDEFL